MEGDECKREEEEGGGGFPYMITVYISCSFDCVYWLCVCVYFFKEVQLQTNTEKSSIK